MTDEHQLQPRPDQIGSLGLGSEAGSELVSRGQDDISALMTKRRNSVYLARVMIEQQGVMHCPKCGLIDKKGNYVAQPIYLNLSPFHEGRCAFRDYDDGFEPLMSDPISETYDVWTGESERIDTKAFDEPDYSGSWSFLDASGKPITEARFELVTRFSEGLAAVKQHDKWGFIDHAGEIVIKPRFDDVRDFRDGLCIAFLGEKCGFIDKTGKFVIAPAFDDLGEFSDGLALAKKHGSFGYIDRSGSYAIESRFAEADNFNCGLARVEWMRFRGYIDRQGTFIYRRMKHRKETLPGLRGSIVYRRGNRASAPPPGLGKFIDGIAFLRRDRRVFEEECGHTGGRCDGICGESLCTCDLSLRLCKECSFCLCGDCTNGKGVFLDTSGRSILDGQSHLLEPLADFSEGLGLVRLRKPAGKDGPSHLYGFVDAGGQMRISPQFAAAHPFKNGHARVKLKDGGWTWIDSEGNAICDKSFASESELHDFEGGFGRFERNELSGFVDANGNTVVEPIFEWVSDFANGMAVVTEPESRKSGYIDGKGETVIPYRFDHAEAFEQANI